MQHALLGTHTSVTLKLILLRLSKSTNDWCSNADVGSQELCVRPNPSHCVYNS